MVTGLGITCGAHRLWSHRSYKAGLPWRIGMLLLNSVANQGSIYHWVRHQSEPLRQKLRNVRTSHAHSGLRTHADCSCGRRTSVARRLPPLPSLGCRISQRNTLSRIARPPGVVESQMGGGGIRTSSRRRGLAAVQRIGTDREALEVRVLFALLERGRRSERTK